MKKQKGFIQIVVLTLATITFAIVFPIYIIVSTIFGFAEPCRLKGYYKCDNYSEGSFDDEHTDFYKYYYKEDNDSKFANSKYYKKIDEDDIDLLEPYLVNFEHVLKNSNRLEGYDLNETMIDTTDYYTMWRDDEQNFDFENGDYVIYYYDTNTHVLYNLDVKR